MPIERLMALLLRINGPPEVFLADPPGRVKHAPATGPTRRAARHPTRLQRREGGGEVAQLRRLLDDAEPAQLAGTLRDVGDDLDDVVDL